MYVQHKLYISLNLGSLKWYMHGGHHLLRFIRSPFIFRFKKDIEEAFDFLQHFTQRVVYRQSLVKTNNIHFRLW